MELQQLLDRTNEVLSNIQIQHRSTLTTNDNLHKRLGDIKDFLFSFIDEIGEDIVISGKFPEFDTLEKIEVISDREKVYKESIFLVDNYIDDLQEFYKSTKDLEIQNDYMAKAKELRVLLAKLTSVCPEMNEKEDGSNEDDTEEKTKGSPIKRPKI